MNDAESREVPMSMEQAMARLGMTRAEVYREAVDGRLEIVKVDGQATFAPSRVNRRADELAELQKGLKGAAHEWLERFGADDSGSPGDEAPFTAVAEAMLAYSISSDARDVYLDPVFRGDRVLVRREGRLEDLGLMPGPLAAEVKKSIAGLAGLSESNDSLRSLSIFERGSEGDERQIRATLTRTILGPQLHLRIYEMEMSASLREVGYTDDQAATLASLLSIPGILIVCSLDERNGDRHRLALVGTESTSARLVVSLERRIHYRSAELVQLEFDASAEGGFTEAWETASGMNPDVLLMDNIVTGEEAAAVARAAAFGRTVVVFMSTTSPEEALRRIEGLGVERRVFGTLVSGLIETRNLPLPCTNCGGPRADVKNSGDVPAAAVTGCDECGHSGYLGTRVFRGVSSLVGEADPVLKQAEWDYEALRAAIDGSPLGLNSVIGAATRAEDIHGPGSP